MSAADIARIAGVRPSAVSNWRRRHDDFPRPVGGTDKNPRFDLADVEAWLRSQGRAPEIPADERLWQAFESARGVMPSRTRWSRPGCCCTTSHPQPAARRYADNPAEAAPRCMDEAEHALAFGSRRPGLRADRTCARPSTRARGRSPCCTPWPRPPRGERPRPRLRLPLLPRPRRGPAHGPRRDAARSSRTSCSTSPRRRQAAPGPRLRERHHPARRRQARLRPGRGPGTDARWPSSRRCESRSPAPRPSTSTPGTHSARTPTRRHSADAVVCNPPFADRNWGAEDAGR